MEYLDKGIDGTRPNDEFMNVRKRLQDAFPHTLKKILSSLNNTTSVFDEGTGEFNTIDVNLAKNNLQLTERSSENGSKNIPAITSSKNILH